MKTAEQHHKERPEIFAPDGYEMDDAPKDVAEAMDAARKAPALSADFLPPPAELVLRKRKRTTTIRINEDTLAWFKSFGSGYQTKINAVLDSYKAAHDPRKV
jgi:uncharacterized protein (DUF4415 family)